jgi:hypothetical protein
MKRLAPSLIAVSLFAALPAAAQEEPAPAPVDEPPPKPKPTLRIEANQRNVTVFVDDKAVAYELPNAPIELEPGPHAITLQRNEGGTQRLTQSVVAGDGETRVQFTFEKPPELESVLEPPENAPIAPRIIAGVGAAGVITGVVLLLARPTLPTNCSSDGCTRLSAETDAKFAQEQDDASQNRAFGTAGLVTLIAGGALIAGGVLWYILDREPFKAAKPPTAQSGWSQWLRGGVTF